MSVDIEPFELSFRRPFTQEVSEILKIKNPNTSPVAFKVKTTAPKQYCVRPNSGRVEPGQEVEVTVLLQAMKQEPPLDARCKDKFLVQSAIIAPEQDFGSIPAVFEAVEKGSIQEKKIRVSWLPSRGGGDNPTAGAMAVTPNRGSMVNGHDGTPDISKVYDSPGEGDVTTTAPPAYESAVKDDSSEHEKAPSTVSAATTAVTNAVQMTYEELKAKLERAEVELAALKEKGLSGLRQRNVKGADGQQITAGQVATAVREKVEGVPVQIVAALCFLSFLLAYLFF